VLAVQRASVTGVTVTMVATETLLASAVGLFALGDTPSHGRSALAMTGFGLTLAGALVLAHVDLLRETGSVAGRR
jgi:hypothetical protein